MSFLKKLKEFVKRKVVMYNKGEISLKDYLPEYYRISLDKSGYVDFIYTSENGEFNIEIYNLYKKFWRIHGGIKVYGKKL